MSWLEGLKGLAGIVSELREIRLQLTRLADAAEGRTPPRESPEPPDEAPTMAPAHTDREFSLIEDIEQRYLALSGRMPTEEEICRELDGEEVPDEVSHAAFLRQMRIR